MPDQCERRQNRYKQTRDRRVFWLHPHGRDEKANGSANAACYAKGPYHKQHRNEEADHGSYNSQCENRGRRENQKTEQYSQLLKSRKNGAACTAG